MIYCAKCWLKVDDENEPSAELNIVTYRNNEKREKVYEYIKLCQFCAKDILSQCRIQS